MTRLTRRDPDGAANFADAEFESVCAELTPTNREKVREIVDALAEYEDAKECGAIAVLPCNVGDTVYQTDGVRVYESAVKKLVFDYETN